MKNIQISIVISVTLLVTACQKDDILKSAFNVNTAKYETTLYNDYSNALLIHRSLKSAPADTAYLRTMFSTYDSLFSVHYYAFCVDMVQNSGMMNTSSKMMGSNSGMMGGKGAMMNGSYMGSLADKDAMIDFMDSLHQTTQSLLNHDYMNYDSLMRNQLIMCNMMTLETDSIETIYGSMHIIRRNHRLMHGN